MIPKNISRDHVLLAIADMGKGGIRSNRTSKKFLLEHEGYFYPPKYVISRANLYANGIELNPEEFSGGFESNRFLISLGFSIVPVAHSVKKPSKPIPTKSIVNPRKVPPDSTGRHDEYCPECKRVILLMLEKAYGEAKSNYRMDFQVTPESFRNTQHYHLLMEIFKALQAHRGFTDFIRSAQLPPFDFFVPRPGFIIEFDESQHFTKPREIALRLYPDGLKLGYDKDTWVKRCQRLNKKDNDPPFRDEQRAWYDTLRDFCCNIKGIPIIRLLPNEPNWCSMNPENHADVARFKSIINGKMEKHLTKPHQTEGSFRIGLVFPEIEDDSLKHTLKHFLPLIERHRNSLNLLVFPEGFETIIPNGELEPEVILKWRSDKINDIATKYVNLSKNLSNISIIVGVQVDYEKSLNMGGSDQYCLCVQPDCDPRIYHKHSTSKFRAFFDSNWSLDDNFPVMDIGGKRIGVSICHDMYISLIPRLLKTKGADIWVNLTGQNVISSKWEAVLKSRAAENKFFAVCTLHRNLDESNVQKEPYAFSPKGKIRLRELSTGKDIDYINEDKRAGRIYFFDTADYDISISKAKEPSGLSDKAERMTVSLKNFRVTHNGGSRYRIFEISITDFLYFPEKLWKICLDQNGAVVIFVAEIGDDDWAMLKTTIEAILPARVIEFSTLFVFASRRRNKVFLAGYQSGNFKSQRVFYPPGFPFIIDKRFLFGLDSTYKISLNSPRPDPRGKPMQYFERIRNLVDHLTAFGR